MYHRCMRRFVFALALFAASCATVQSPSQQLAAIAEEHWQRQLATDVSTRSELGLPIERLPDPSFEEAQRDAEFSRKLLARLERIDASKLSEDEQISLAILRHLHQQTVDGLPHFWTQFQVTPYASPIRPLQMVFGQLQFKAAEDTARYLRLLEEYARFIDRLTTVVQEQQRRGILIPKREIPAVKTLLTSAALMVAPARLEAIPEKERALFLDAMRNAITLSVNPALARLNAVFSKEYEAAAPEAIGIGQYPGGAEAYRYLIRVHTSYDLTPQELHETGLRELERIDHELADVRAAMSFTGPKREFYPFLQQFWTTRGAFRDPQGHFTTYVRRIEPYVSRFFAVTPRAPYDTRRLAPALETVMTFGFYQRPTASDPMGHYYFNGSPSKPRSIIFGGALMAHELIPGHHFQIARQIESEQLPLWRRQRYDTVFVEGWGEYAAMLAAEMGLYDMPHDRAGRLMMDALVSTRLVVDTGLNAFGWSYDRAREFMREHTPLTDEEIDTEILRYSVDIPGQALAYKTGAMKIMEMRRAWTGDVRGFHEWVLGGGSVPLGIKSQSLIVSESHRQ